MANSSEKKLPAGTVIGERYRLEGELGAGGMGTVYLGRDLSLERSVAVKLIAQDQKLNQIAKERFNREAQVLSRLNHPGICQIYDLVSSENGDAIILEFIPGTTLAEAVQTDYSKRDKLNYAVNLAQALSVAHDQNLIHRDLKPENIMITEERQIKILDFGLAKPVEEPHEVGSLEQPQISSESAQSGTTQQGVIVGTPRYMSPEQAKGEPLTTASDIYSLGLILQFLFSGKHPYSPHLSSVALYWKVANAETIPVTNLDPDLTELINRMKNPSPGSRPAAQDVVSRLQWLLDAPKRRTRKTIAASSLLVLAISTLVSSLGFMRASQAERQARLDARRANETLVVLDQMFTSADPGDQGREVKVVELLDTFSQDISKLSGDWQVQSKLLRTFGRTYESLGQFQRANELFSAALVLNERNNGVSHPTSLEAAVDVAYSLNALGLPEQAVQLLKPRLKNHDLSSDANVIHAFAALADAYDLSSQYDEANTIHELILGYSIHNKGESHEDTSDLRCSYASFLYAFGQDELAQQHLEIALESYEQALGPHHPSTISTLSSLANIYEQGDRQDEGLRMHEEALKRSQASYGPAHLTTLLVLSNYVDSLYQADRFHEAEPLAKQLYEQRLVVLGESHLDSHEAGLKLAQILVENGHLEKSDTLFESATLAFSNQLGPDNMLTLAARANWAAARAQRGEPQALEELKSIILLGVKTLDANEPVLLDLKWTLGDTYTAMGQVEQAKNVYTEMLLQVTAELGPDANLTREIERSLTALNNAPSGNEQ